MVGVLCITIACVATAQANDFVAVPGGEFRSVVPVEVGNNQVNVASFELQATPVTNADFLRFVMYQPEWQRGRVKALFADAEYLSTWAGPIALGETTKTDQPVTHVSWFAANAYCASQDARLPTWYEWEYVAAASEVLHDARDSAAWRQEILDWYATTGTSVEPVGRNDPNAYGIQDLHGLVWEWVDDFSSLLVIGDSREQGGADLLKFCGAGAINLEAKENYATLMRIAMLSSLEARFSTSNLGFRCARDVSR